MRLDQPDPEITAKLCELIRAGASVVSAARFAGVPLRALQTWLTIPAFAEALEVAHAQSMVAAQIELRRQRPAIWLARQPPEAARPLQPNRRARVRDKCSARQERFVREYLKDGNGRQAAIRAGYSPGGAEVRASELLRNRMVAQALKAECKRRLAATGATGEDVLRELESLAFFNPKALFDENGKLLPLNELPAEVAGALTRFEIVKLFDGAPGRSSLIGHLYRLRFTGKVRALELLGRYLGLFADKRQRARRDSRPLDNSPIARHDEIRWPTEDSPRRQDRLARICRRFSLRRERFISEYVKDGNGRQAAIRAGYSPKGAEVRASELLSNRKIAEAIEAARNQAFTATGVTAERVLREVARIAFYDPYLLFDEDGNIRPISDSPAEATAALSGMAAPQFFDDQAERRSPRVRRHKLQFLNKIRALGLLARYLGMFDGKGGQPLEPDKTKLKFTEWRDQYVKGIEEREAELRAKGANVDDDTSPPEP